MVKLMMLLAPPMRTRSPVISTAAVGGIRKLRLSPNQHLNSKSSNKCDRLRAHRSFSRPLTTTPTKIWNVYLSGEIHSDWRNVIANEVQRLDLPVQLLSPNTSHEDSDDCGAIILGMEEERRHWDSIGARMNAIRTQTYIRSADVVVIKFGDQYRQWNAAFDAGYATALCKPIITLHPPNLSHMLKEVNAMANVVCTEPIQVVQSLAYVIQGTLPAKPFDGDAFVPIADRLGKGNPNP